MSNQLWALLPSQYYGDLADTAIAIVLVTGKHSQSLHILKENVHGFACNPMLLGSHIISILFLNALTPNKFLELQVYLKNLEVVEMGLRTSGLSN